MARNDTDWSKPQPSARQEREAQQMAEEIAASYGDDYGAGFFDYGPMTAPSVSYDAAMAANQADRIANTLAAQASISSAQQKLADMAARDAQRQEIARQQEIELAAAAAEEARRNQVIEELRAREAAMGGAPSLGFGFGYMPPRTDLGLGFGASLGAVTYPDVGAGFGASLGALTYPTLPQDQQAAITRYLERGRPTGLGGLLSGGVYDRIASGGPEMEPVFGPSGEVIGVRHPGFIPGTRVYSGQSMGGDDSDDQPEVTPTVTNPATGREECPDGYIFDPDLNACRLDTRNGMTTAPDASTAPVTPGEMYARTGLLDVAPEGLMGFRERYGAGFGTPSDFGAANLAFRQQAAISPEYFQTPPKLTGYTLL